MKPILFNADMVKAILDGRKTVTRRLVKRTPSNDEPCGFGFWREFNESDKKWYIKDYTHSCTWYPENEYMQRFGKFKIGDILYVRETWQCLNPYSDKEYVYKASCDIDFANDIGKWLPSIHMPKEVARIFLRVTDVRVERLHDMNQEDALKEGLKLQCHRTDDDCSAYLKCNFQNTVACLDKFRELWNSTIPKKDPGVMYKYGWKANPWVWVIEFERISKEDAYDSKC
jgi:hypothetical protein|nr:hypothetical protein [uncultured Lachnoclostridium sp.]